MNRSLFQRVRAATEKERDEKVVGVDERRSPADERKFLMQM